MQYINSKAKHFELDIGSNNNNIRITSTENITNFKASGNIKNMLGLH